MTIHIQMLQDIATHAHAMADAMQAIVDDCAEQLARRKAASESEESIMNEPFQKETKQSDGFTPYHARNRYLVDHADTLLALYNGTPTGGTAYTVKYAYQRNKEIIVIAPNTMERKVIPPRLQEL